MKKKPASPPYEVSCIVELNEADFQAVCTVLGNVDPALQQRFIKRSRGLRPSEIVMRSMESPK